MGAHAQAHEIHTWDGLEFTLVGTKPWRAASFYIGMNVITLHHAQTLRSKLYQSLLGWLCGPAFPHSANASSMIHSKDNASSIIPCPSIPRNPIHPPGHHIVHVFVRSGTQRFCVYIYLSIHIDLSTSYLSIYLSSFIYL